MDYILTDEQMTKFAYLCVRELNKKQDEKYSMSVWSCKYPNMTVLLSKPNFLKSCNLSFKKDSVLCKWEPICDNMNEIYIKFMVKLFGEKYISSLIYDKQESIKSKKQEIKERANTELDNCDKEFDNYFNFIQSFNPKTDGTNV